MKTTYRTLGLAFGALALAFSFAPNAAAQCGGYPRTKASHSSWQYQTGQARLLQAAFVPNDSLDDAGIVGFWHVKFVSVGTAGITDGTEIDAGYSLWHSDGTEIMNSGGRSPITGDYCMGVWARVGFNKYKLNHFGAAWDPTGATLVGPGHIQEEVTLAPGGNKFSGTFNIDQYDESGNVVAHLQGTITGTRINVNTPAESIF
jgi:hypothetical protein